MSNAIEIRGLSWSPGKEFSIEGLDLTVPQGSIYGFLGPNGSGKTSTIRLMLGMARPTAGTSRILGGSVPDDLPESLARVGYVPERPHLFPSLTVDEAIRVHRGFFRGWDAPWAAEMKKAFRLPSSTRVARLSKGETGKLLILLALAQRPDLLVLDEPTDGLDPVVRRDVMAAVLEYVSETGATVFISSHLVHELERFCDWVGVIDAGRMITEMPMEAFKREMRRIRVAGMPATLAAPPPFQVVSRRPGDGAAGGELWVVRGWHDHMEGFFSNAGGTVREVTHLDLEEGFVELLSSVRPEVWKGRNGTGNGTAEMGSKVRGEPLDGTEGEA